jgi:hypothetical protein
MYPGVGVGGAGTGVGGLSPRHQDDPDADPDPEAAVESNTCFPILSSSKSSSASNNNNTTATGVYYTNLNRILPNKCLNCRYFLHSENRNLLEVNIFNSLLIKKHTIPHTFLCLSLSVSLSFIMIVIMIIITDNDINN